MAHKRLFLVYPRFITLFLLVVCMGNSSCTKPNYSIGDCLYHQDTRSTDGDHWRIVGNEKGKYLARPWRDSKWGPIVDGKYSHFDSQYFSKVECPKEGKD